MRIQDDKISKIGYVSIEKLIIFNMILMIIYVWIFKIELFF